MPKKKRRLEVKREEEEDEEEDMTMTFDRASPHLPPATCRQTPKTPQDPNTGPVISPAWRKLASSTEH
jgi:hypothetical protein